MNDTDARAEQLLPVRAIAEVRLLQVEWVRRRVAPTDPDGAARLSEAIVAMTGSAHGVDVAAHPWTGGWLRTAVLLVRRRAPDLLPDGHLAGLLSAARNMTAAVAVLDGASAVEVRLDGRGAALLPGCGRTVHRGADAAGAVRRVDVDGARPVPGGIEVSAPDGIRKALDDAVTDARTMLGPELDRARNGRILLVAAGSGYDHRDLAVGLQEGPRSVDQLAGLTRAAVVAASATERAPDDTAVGSAPPRGGLAAALAAAGVPAPSGVNRLGDRELRRDASFDHLSLLSVNDPDTFARIEHHTGNDPGAARLAGHCAYIRRDFASAAHLYGSGLAAAPDDTDLWRDLCWSLRHDGRDDLATAWVLDPEGVISAATATPPADLAAAVRLLEGMTP